MSGGSLAAAAESITTREPQVTVPLVIGTAAGVPSQDVMPVQAGPPLVVTARKTWILPVFSSMAIWGPPNPHSLSSKVSMAVSVDQLPRLGLVAESSSVRAHRRL